MKIALIRGPSLNPWDLESFRPLFPRHAVSVFATTRTPYWNVDSISGAILERCAWPDAAVARVSPYAAALLNGASSRLLGVSFHMAGLVDLLKSFDILHALETHNTLTYQCLQAKRKWGGKLVVTVWETIPHRGESHPLRTWRKKQVLKEADAFHAVTERSRQMLLKEGVSPHRIHVLFPGIDTDHFSPTPSPLHTDFVLLCVARLVRSKGVYDLLEMLHLLQAYSDGQRVKLEFIGQGPEENGMRRWVSQHGLSARVQFRGAVPYDLMPKAYAAADATALPSVSTPIWEEQFGYALAEALSMGKPVITTDSGAIPYVVGDAAIICPPSNPAALADAVMTLLRDPGKTQRLGQRGRARALEHFQGRLTAAAMENLYHRLLEGNNP